MKFLFLISFLHLFTFANITIEIGDEQSQLHHELRKLLERSSKRLEKAGARRPFRYSAMNDSLALTAEASSSIRRGGSKEDILKKLDTAQKKYKENSYIYLLKAFVYDTQGNPELANDTFVEYLVKSRTFTGYDKKYIKERDFHRLRKLVYELLITRGVDVESQSEKFETIVPFEQLMYFVLYPEKNDVIASMVLLVITIGGGILLILGAFFGVSLKGPFLSSIPTLYAFAWLTYILWILDLAFGLPFKLSRHTVVTAYFIGAPFIFITSGIFKIWKKKNAPLEEGFRLCPKCDEPIVTLATQCPHCHTKF